MTFLRQFSVTEFGARGDARQISDATIAGGALSTLTSATAGFAANDVGLGITIQNAGATTTTSLVTTIAGYTNATTVTLAASATNAVTNVVAVMGTKNNSAFNSAFSVAGANEVIVPPGTYLFQNGTYIFPSNPWNLLLRRGATLLHDGSQGNGRSFQVASDNWSIAGQGTIDGNYAAMSDVATAGTAGAVINVSGSRQNWAIRDITIQNSPLYGVGFSNSYNCLIRGVSVNNCAVALNNTTTTGSLSDIVVENCKIDLSNVVYNATAHATVYTTGIGVGGSGLPTRCRIANNIITLAPANTANLDISSQGIVGNMADSVITGNVVQGGSISISPAGSNGLTISGNTCFAPLNYGIELPGVINAVVTGNTVDMGAVANSGILVDGTNSKNIAITGNTVFNSATTGSNMAGIGLSGTTPTNVTISGNFVTMALGRCIYNNGKQKVTITGNHLVNAGSATDGIWTLNGSYVTIANNTCIGSFSSGATTLTGSGSPTLTNLVVTGNSSDSAQALLVNNFSFGASCLIANNSGATRIVTAATTITAADDTIVFNSATLIPTQALPAVTAYPAGKILTLTNKGAGSVYIGSTIAGSSSRTINQWETLTVYTDGAVWLIA